MPNNASDVYVSPVLRVHSTFEQAKKFFDEEGPLAFFERGPSVRISDVVDGKRNLIVGEPGVGKTELIRKVEEHLRQQGLATGLVSLRDRDSLEKIDAFLASAARQAILLDGLDEVQSSRFPQVLQKIDAISRELPNLLIFISCRWVFISRYAVSFPDFRFISISPFTRAQVREYLSRLNHPSADIDELLNRVMSFGHQTLVIQIPRYLSYLERFLTDRGITAASAVSRNELFEYFIYAKLELEDKRLHAQKRLLTKRVLEKLALTMEIYQSNVLTKDELMTFLDELNSKLTLVALSQWKLETFYEKSLLKDGIDTIEFDNSEFQEYLAAKEITRLPNASRAAFAIATDQTLQELFPSWFNALTFLVDMQPEILEQLLEYSAIRGAGFKVVEPLFFEFLSRVSPRAMSHGLRRRVFTDVLNYHRRTRQWLPGKLVAALPGYFDPSLDGTLRAIVDEAKSESGASRFVALANVANLIGHLLRSGTSIDRPLWRERMITYATDDNAVLQRHALFALSELGDVSVVDELPDLSESDELVARAFLDMCIDVAPNHPRCIGYLVAATKLGKWEARHGFAALSSKEAIKSFLAALEADGDFRRQFLRELSYTEEEDRAVVRNIAQVLDTEIRDLSKQVLLRCLDFELGQSFEDSEFLAELWKVLQANDPEFLLKMVHAIDALPDKNAGFYLVTGLIARVITPTQVTSYLDAMLELGERAAAHSTMIRVKRSDRADREEVYELGRSRLAPEYASWEASLANAAARSQNREEELLKEFEKQLQPEAEKFSSSVFRFYKQNAQRLAPLVRSEHKDRLRDLIENTILKFVDPAGHGVTITENSGATTTYRMSSALRMFGDALPLMEELKLDIAPHRQRILNFIPFAFSDELKAVFRLVRNIQPAELQPVVDMYKSRSSDLWRHQPSNLVEAVEQYHVVDAIPILRQFVGETAFDRYTRRKALTVSESLMPDSSFLVSVFERYQGSAVKDEIAVAETANALLIKAHADPTAIRWRLDKVISNVVPFVQPSGVHRVGDVEDELHSKSFAAPLMQLKRPGFENEYLKLIDESMKVWLRGEQFHTYAAYLWDITYAYFDNLKEGRSYLPLQQVERKIAEMRDQEGANWVASRMASLRRSYLSYLGKPRSISEAVHAHNEAREYDDRKIRNSHDLYRHLQNVFEFDIKRWIEGEGAYELIIGEKVYATKKQEYEKLIQKTLKAQIETMLLRRGFQVELIREPQLYDEKRTDFVVRYGFVGPIVVEVKLTSNSDMKARDLEKSPSFRSMERYMAGYGASYGIFLVIDNDATSKLSRIKSAFQKIPNVWVESFDCKGNQRVRSKKRAAPRARSRRSVSGKKRH